MSDSNPFDEPKLTSNPFEEDLNSNPEQSDLVHDTSQQQSSISYSVVSESGRGWQERWALTAEKISLSYPPFTISVSNPEVFGNMMSRYVTYTVKAEPQGSTVRRRYSEFVWLRENLLKTYPGLFVPALPVNVAITSGTKVDSPFVQTRLAQLHLFAHQLTEIPYLRSDRSLNAFLSVVDDKEFKAVADATTKSNHAEDSTEGAVLWRSSLEQLSTQVSADSVIIDVKRQLETLRSSLKTLLDEIINTGKQSQLFAKQVATLTAAFSNVNETESAMADASIASPNPFGQQMKILSDALVVGVGHCTSQTQLTPVVISSVLLASVSYQLVQLEGFREFLRGRDTLQAALEKAEKEKIKLLEDKTKAASGSSSTMSFFSKGASSLEESFQKKDEQVMALAAALLNYTRGLLYSEIERFHKDRSVAMKLLAGSFAAVQLEMQQRSVDKWKEIAGLAQLRLVEYDDIVADVLNFSSSEAKSGGGTDADMFSADV